MFNSVSHTQTAVGPTLPSLSPWRKQREDKANLCYFYWRIYRSQKKKRSETMSNALLRRNSSKQGLQTLMRYVLDLLLSVRFSH